MRRFVFNRIEDATGVSGTGTVVEGVEFTDGSVALTWLSDIPSVTIYRSVEEAVQVHGHEGRTRLVWIDKPSPYRAEEEKSKK